jgi:hypothetical protein
MDSQTAQVLSGGGAAGGRPAQVQSGDVALFWDHHLINEIFQSNPVVDTLGINLDDAPNRIYLSADPTLAADLGLTPHAGSHLAAYTRGVGTALRNIADEIFKVGDVETTLLQAAKGGNAEALTELRTEFNILQDALEVGIVNGDVYTNYPTNLDRSFVRNKTLNFLADYKGYLLDNADLSAAIKALRASLGAEAGKWVSLLDGLSKDPAIANLTTRQKVTAIYDYIRAHSNGNFTQGSKGDQGYDDFLQAVGEPKPPTVPEPEEPTVPGLEEFTVPEPKEFTLPEPEGPNIPGPEGSTVPEEPVPGRETPPTVTETLEDTNARSAVPNDEAIIVSEPAGYNKTTVNPNPSAEIESTAKGTAASAAKPVADASTDNLPQNSIEPVPASEAANLLGIDSAGFGEVEPS